MSFSKSPAVRWGTILLSSAALCLQSVSAQAQTYSGCYSSPGNLVNQGYNTFQAQGYCQPHCQGLNQPVYALSDASYCWCGPDLPPANTLVSGSNCNLNCSGYPANICGGTKFYSVFLTGIEGSVPHAAGSSASSSSSTPQSTSTASPSIVTSVQPGQTVVRTVAPSASSGSSSSGGSNVAGIAAGVVVGVLGLSAVVGGVIFYIRRRRQQYEDEETRRANQVSNFIRSGERKPSMTGYSQMSDSRLDPEAGNRRNSHGSIADNQDYSRRILRVANPDSS